MPWILEHKNIWRALLLGMLLVALLGPWAFDKLSVPAEYPCGSPTVRLSGDFCGYPLSGLWILGGFVSELINRIGALSAGIMTASDIDVGSKILLSVVLLVLPFFSTLLLILTGSRHRLQTFNIVAWGLALGFVVLFEFITSFSSLYWSLWGLLLYAGLAIAALTLELATLAADKRLSTG